VRAGPLGRSGFQTTKLLSGQCYRLPEPDGLAATLPVRSGFPKRGGEGGFGGDELAAVSDGLTHLHMQFYGRGPTKAKTHLVDDLLVCVLHNGFTTVEETLIAHDEADAVKGFRGTFQKAMKDEIIDVAETATGREVIAYMSEIDVASEVAIEVFLLKPR
jgi:uncharacterized protein YbcI